MNPIRKLKTSIRVYRESGCRGIVDRLTQKYGLSLAVTRKAKWQHATFSEISFWDEYIRTRGKSLGDDLADHYLNATLPLQDDIVALLPQRFSKFTLLDVGAGPFTFIGKTHPHIVFTIVAVDPLAEEYDRILNKYSIKPLIRTQKLHAERLQDRFAPDTFDLVFARNCIDHSYSPEKAIVQMIRVVKPGHHVLMYHRPNEAETENYRGLHQWNFSEDSGDFIIKSKTRRINMTQKYKSLAAFKCFQDVPQNWLITQITKSASASA